MGIERYRWNGDTWDLMHLGPHAPIIPPNGDAPTEPVTLGFIGDSLTYQNGDGCLANGGDGTDVRDSLVSVGFNSDSRVDGLIGRSIVNAGPTPLSQDVVAAWRADGFDPKNWVIALGSNNVGATDQQWTNYINTLLDFIADGSRSAYNVFWVGITFRPDVNDDRSTRFKAVMDAVAAARADKINVYPIDFNSLIHDGRDESGLWLSTDGSGRHMTGTGYGVRNQIIADALAATVPDNPAPAPGGELVTTYGFNTWGSWDAYTNGTNESDTTMLTRLVGDYGDFEWTKTFYGGSFLPSSWNNLSNGENNPVCPANSHIICFGWTLGTIANGSHDSQLTSFALSVPAGKRVILCMNEVDAPGRISNWGQYVADMDHMYDLVESLTLDGQVEVMDCFMQYALDDASGPRFQNSWTNPEKRHGLVWDMYWNQYTIDASGDLYVGTIESKMNQLGMDTWVLGEWGDRRPGSTGSNPAPDDTSRAARLTTHLDRLLSADPKPDGLVYFNTIGTTGDHRILPAEDPLTYAVLADYMDDVAE